MNFHEASRTRQDKHAVAAVSRGFVQRKRPCGQHKMDNGLNLQQQPAKFTGRSMPPIVHDVIRSPGRSLGPAERAFMESRFNQDFSGVHVHTDNQAAQSARAVNARAYTVHNDIVFGQGQFQPTSAQGQRLLAHELAHVLQQEKGGDSTGAETRAMQAAQRVADHQTVLPGEVGSAASGLYADNGEPEESQTTASAREVQPAFSLSWSDLARIGVFELTPPSLQAPPPRRLSLGSPLLSSPTSPTLSVPGLPPPRLSLTDPTLATPTSPLSPISPTASETETEEESSAPSMPSRLSVLSSGRFSIGLRLGFPELESRTIPGMPASALAESLRRATIMNQILTGNVPSGWEALDKGKLAKAIWKIFSTNIAPDLAGRITSGLSAPAGPASVSYELDLVLLTDFSSDIGGGLSFTVRFPSFESLFTGR